MSETLVLYRFIIHSLSKNHISFADCTSITMLRTALRRLQKLEHPVLSPLPSFSSLSDSSLQNIAPAPNKKLFVGGLSYSVDEKSLNDAFSSFGEVTEVRIMYDKNSGRSRGFGFVHFSNQDEAASAKDAMDGKAFLGRPLRISFAVDKVRGEPIIVPRISTRMD